MFDWVKNKHGLQAKNSDADDALANLFRVQRQPLLRFVQSKVQNEAEAEEIVQECFIRFQKKYDVEETTSPEALLARIATNLVIDRVRERKARENRENSWGEIHTDNADEALRPSQYNNPAQALAAKQQIELALNVLDTLPVKTRQIFLLHRFEELSHAEISAQTGIPKSTIEKHMIKAIKALTKLKENI